MRKEGEGDRVSGGRAVASEGEPARATLSRLGVATDPPGWPCVPLTPRAADRSAQILRADPEHKEAKALHRKVKKFTKAVDDGASL